MEGKSCGLSCEDPFCIDPFVVDGFDSDELEGSSFERSDIDFFVGADGS